MERASLGCTHRTFPLSWNTGTEAILGSSAETQREVISQARNCILIANNILRDVAIQLRDEPGIGFKEMYNVIGQIEPGISSMHEAVVTFPDSKLHTQIRSINASDNLFPRTYSIELVAKGWLPLRRCKRRNSNVAFFAQIREHWLAIRIPQADTNYVKLVDVGAISLI